MITLTLTPAQAEDVIRDLGRAIVLLDRAGKRAADPLEKRACVEQTNALQDLVEDLDALCRGLEAPVARRTRWVIRGPKGQLLGAGRTVAAAVRVARWVIREGR